MQIKSDIEDLTIFFITKSGFTDVSYYIGGMKRIDRELAEKKRLILSTFTMAAEGLDIKKLNTMILASPKSEITQAIGRIQRQKHEVVPLVIDIIDKQDLFKKQWLKRRQFYHKNGYTIKYIDNYDSNNWYELKKKDVNELFKKIPVNMNLEINSFSVYMNESKFDERKYCEEVSKVFNTNHDYVQFDEQITLEMVDSVLETLDEPFADPSYIPTFLLSNMISNKYKVALSGDGGDELLGGYLRVQKAMKNTNFISSSFNHLIYNLYPAQLGTGSTFLSKNIDLNTRYNSFLSDSKLFNMLGINNENITLNQFSENKFKNNYKQLMENEYKFFLSQMMMFKVDRASMANSLEIRSPFVDNKLIEYVFSHSNEYFNINKPYIISF